jgi:hypothetical protein
MLGRTIELMHQRKEDEKSTGKKEKEGNNSYWWVTAFGFSLSNSSHEICPICML